MLRLARYHPSYHLLLERVNGIVQTSEYQVVAAPLVRTEVFGLLSTQNCIARSWIHPWNKFLLQCYLKFLKELEKMPNLKEFKQYVS